MTRKLRLTDQALVAVKLARAQAEAAGRRATLVDGLVALSQEPDGAAGRLLRRRPGAASLAVRAVSPRMPVLDVALAWAASDITHRPLWTVDLLAAIVETGGSELADVLESVGYGLGDLDAGRLLPDGDPALLLRVVPQAEAEADPETFGLVPGGTAALTPAAALAVARARAVAGDACDLLVALHGVHESGWPAPHERRVSALVRAGPRRGTVDEVLRVATSGGERAGCSALLLAIADVALDDGH